jgi:hypothetical protein
MILQRRGDRREFIPAELPAVDSSIRSFRYGIQESRQKVAVATRALVKDRTDGLRAVEELRTIIEKIHSD